MNLKEATRILVLDTIHGAEIIAEELKGLGKQAEVFDPYHQTFSKALDYDLVIAPVHLNPNVQRVARHVLGDHERILLLEPLSYVPFVRIMKESFLVVTDSGATTSS